MRPDLPTTKRRSLSTRRDQRSGYALLIVMIVILTTTALAAVHQRQLSAALRVERARVESEAHAQGPVTVLAIAIDRLKTGDPPTPIAYHHWHSTSGGSTLFEVSYDRDGTDWTVTVTPDPDAGLLPVLPDSF